MFFLCLIGKVELFKGVLTNDGEIVEKEGVLNAVVENVEVVEAEIVLVSVKEFVNKEVRDVFAELFKNEGSGGKAENKLVEFE